MWNKSRKTFGGFCVLAAALAVCLGVTGAPGDPPRDTITLEWNAYPPGAITPELVLKIYSTTNPTLPLSSWPLLATVNPTNTRITLPIDYHQRFYVMTASNWWAESFFSNGTNTPPTLRLTNSLRLGP